MQKKLLIPILVVLVLVIVLMVRGCGNKDASQGDKSGRNAGRADGHVRQYEHDRKRRAHRAWHDDRQ